MNLFNVTGLLVRYLLLNSCTHEVKLFITHVLMSCLLSNIFMKFLFLFFCLHLNNFTLGSEQILASNSNCHLLKVPGQGSPSPSKLKPVRRLFKHQLNHIFYVCKIIYAKEKAA